MRLAIIDFFLFSFYLSADSELPHRNSQKIETILLRAQYESLSTLSLVLQFFFLL